MADGAIGGPSNAEKTNPVGGKCNYSTHIAENTNTDTDKKDFNIFDPNQAVNLKGVSIWT